MAHGTEVLQALTGRHPPPMMRPLARRSGEIGRRAGLKIRSAKSVNHDHGTTCKDTPEALAPRLRSKAGGPAFERDCRVLSVQVAGVAEWPVPADWVTVV